MKTYSRHYPYACALLKKEGNVVLPIEIAEGYVECDLTGFPMTLIKKDLFVNQFINFRLRVENRVNTLHHPNNFCQNFSIITSKMIHAVVIVFNIIFYISYVLH
jgi:hypothetical protein